MGYDNIHQRSADRKLCVVRRDGADPADLGQDGQAGHHAGPPDDWDGQPLPHRGGLHGSGLEQVCTECRENNISDDIMSKSGCSGDLSQIFLPRQSCRQSQPTS